MIYGVGLYMLCYMQDIHKYRETKLARTKDQGFNMSQTGGC